MPDRRPHLLGRVLAAALVLVVPALALPAYADATHGSVSGIDGVLYDDCVPHPYSYAVNVPAGAGAWDLRVTLLGPDGRQAGTDFVAEPTTGSSAFVLCPPANSYGTYTVRAVLEWGADPEHVDQSSTLDDAHFTLRKPRTRTGLTVSTRRPAYGQRVSYRINVRDERPGGYLPTAFAWVHLEKRVDGRWVRVRGGRAMTHSTGRITVRLTYRGHHRRTWVRAVTEPTPTFTRSVSPRLRLW